MRVVFLGDSVTAGFGLSEHVDGLSYVELLSARLADHPCPPELIASAFDGVDTAYALKRFSRMVTAHDPDWVVILLGLNDAIPSGGRPAASPHQYRENLLALVDRVLSLGARPVLVTPNPRFRTSDDRGEPQEIMAPYIAELRNVAELGDFPWVDLYAPFMALEAVRKLIPDGVHPGPDGHTLIADVMAVELPCLWQEPHYSADDFVPSDEAPIGWPSGKGLPATE